MRYGIDCWPVNVPVNVDRGRTLRTGGNYCDLCWLKTRILPMCGCRLCYSTTEKEGKKECWSVFHWQLHVGIGR